MRIKKIELKNFKRFTDLVIDNIPEDAKLVLLIGANGSGKSSLFDAFEFLNLISKREPINNIVTSEYLTKNGREDFGISVTRGDNLQIEVSLNERKNIVNAFDAFSFYGRSSFRQIPRLTKTALGQIGKAYIDKDSDRPKYFIDMDRRFQNDIEYITGIILKEFFRGTDSKEQIRDRYITPLNRALENIFGESNGTKIQLIEIIPPLEGKVAQVNFKKGTSEIHYNYLSAGEKEVFNILFNLLSRSESYKDSIYFLDEIDLHLHTKLQFRLIKEITENWIPENSQLWVASHALGFIDYAQQDEKSAIVDFNELDFDKPQILNPSDKSNYQIFELAVSKQFIDKVFQGKRVIYSEDTDTPLYNNLSLENVFFFNGKDKIGVFEKAKNLKLHGLVDRDYLSDDEMKIIKEVYPFIFILPYYSIENLLYHPENLAEFYSQTGKDFDIEDYCNELEKEKNMERDYIAAGILMARGGYPFFKENANAAKLKSFKENYKVILEMLRSTDFEIFYKVFPMKDYGKMIETKQNLSKVELAKTNWFKTQIGNTLK